MKKLILPLIAAVMVIPSQAEQIELGGKDYEVQELISMSIGPGITYKRLRADDYPLNINVLIMDTSNPYNRIETTTANETSQGTELLVKAAKRQTTDEKRVLAGANANFWCVSSQNPWAPTLVGVGYGGSGRNGEMITETNMHSDQWNGGWQHHGIIGIDVDKVLHVGHMYYRGYATNDKIGNPEIYQINKVVRADEICMYNSFYGKNKVFKAVNQFTNSSGKQEWEIVTGDCTEVLLDFAEGQSWKIGQPLSMVVAEVRTDAGGGTLGDHDAALVGRGDKQALLASLASGDVVTIETNYYDSANTPVKLDNFVAGNATVMIGGELTKYNTSETYNSQVYSRTGYGCSADGKTLYVMVIDKATDPTYGRSAGCPTRVMCEIAKHYGCTDMVNCDAGGSAEMYYNGEIINVTTEGTPRAVSNGWFLYSIAPKDDQVARLEFYDVSLLAPSFSSYSPTIIAYNQYGDVIDYDFKGYTLSCAPELGSCDGNTFIAGGTSMTGPLTASYNGVSVSKDITVQNSPVTLRFKPILIDNVREYTMEVNATIGSNVYTYDPSRLDWTVDDNSVVELSEAGVLRGLRNGSTNISVNIGDYNDQTPVTVEIASAPQLDVTDYNDWTFRGSGASDVTMAADGTVNFTVAVARLAPSVELVKTVPFYSLPESLKVTFESDLQIDKVQADVRSPLDTRSNYNDLTNGDAGYAAGTTHTVDFPLSGFADTADLINFPLSLNSLKFTFPKDSSLNGAHYVKVSSIQTVYSNYSGVESVAQDRLAADKVAVAVNGKNLSVASGSSMRSVSIYSVSGALLSRIAVSGNQASINAGNIAPGVYMVIVETSTGVQPVKVAIM